jgi:hypothetical protein
LCATLVDESDYTIEACLRTVILRCAMQPINSSRSPMDSVGDLSCIVDLQDLLCESFPLSHALVLEKKFLESGLA